MRNETPRCPALPATVYALGSSPWFARTCRSLSVVRCIEPVTA